MVYFSLNSGFSAIYIDINSEVSIDGGTQK